MTTACRGQAAEQFLQEGTLIRRGRYLALPGYDPKETELFLDKKKPLEKFLQGEILSMCTREEALAMLLQGTDNVQEVFGERLLALCLEGEVVVALNKERIMAEGAYKQAMELLVQAFLRQGSLSLGEARDLLQASRKSTFALLEHLDALGMTVQDEEERRRLSKATGTR